MNLDISRWRHVFKLDPDREIGDEALDRVCLSGTDAIMVGGSTGVTFDNTVELLARVRRYEAACVLEVSDEEAIVPGFDLYMIPVVLNAARAEWVTGRHQRAIRDYGAMLDWSLVVPEGYVVLNASSTVAQLTEADTALDDKDVVAYARLADKLLRMPIVYIEYSGSFGDMALVKRAAGVLQQARLFYGGGIDGPERARLAAEAAHTIVVGNAVYDDLERALATVAAVKG